MEFKKVIKQILKKLKKLEESIKQLEAQLCKLHEEKEIVVNKLGYDPSNTKASLIEEHLSRNNSYPSFLSSLTLKLTRWAYRYSQ